MIFVPILISRSCRSAAALGSLLLSLAASAQTSNVLTAEDNVPTAAPLRLTLQDALQRTEKTNPEYRLAQTEYGSAK